ncbi:MAG: hypothetical protein AAFP77_02950 [Bacteroidota bacterium]
MKMLVKGLAFAGLLLCLSQAQAANFLPAEGNLLLKVSQVDDEVLLLQIANMQQEATTVSLVDLDGNTFFRKQITKHNGYAWKMNLQDAPDGRYILRVMQKDEQRSQVIYKSDDQILLSHINGKK